MNLSTPLALSTLVHGALLTVAFAVGVYMVPDRSEADLERLARIEIFTPAPTSQIELLMFESEADEEDETEEITAVIPEPELVRSSGHGVLGRAAVEVIASIQTFPSPPDELALARSEHIFDIPVEYSLSASP